MSKLMLVGAFSLSWFLLAADETNGGSWLNFRWQDLTALAIVAVVLIFIVTKMLPDLHMKFIDQSKVFGEAIERIQKAFTDTLDKMHARVEDRDKVRHEDQRIFTQALIELTEQCARRHAAEENRLQEPCRPGTS